VNGAVFITNSADRVERPGMHDLSKHTAIEQAQFIDGRDAVTRKSETQLGLGDLACMGSNGLQPRRPSVAKLEVSICPVQPSSKTRCRRLVGVVA
jgi:hypothetical protein